VPDYFRNVYCVQGLPFDALDIAQATKKIRHAIDEKRRCFFSTPNLNFLVSCQRDPEFRASVIHSDLVVADGMPVVWLARLLGIPIQTRVAGSDVFEVLRKPVGGRKINVFFFGGPDGIAEAASNIINSENLGMRCVGHHSPGFGSIESMSTTEILEAINRSHPDFLVVSLGARKGQEWIVHNLHALNVPVVSHLGAVVNFVAGNIRRAPRAFQMAGMEWLWRIKEEPQLWKRYFDDGLALLSFLASNVFPLLAKQLCDKFVQNSTLPARIHIQDHARHTQLVLEGQWHSSRLQPLREVLTRLATTDCKDLCVDLHSVTDIDSAFVGLLLLAQGYQDSAGHALRIERTSREVARKLKLMGATALCKVD
jgi:N-acetylglucosaminyldiphosphoundecaprenol N-acetyl-beta-D-mannosaminyltransferase